MFSTSARRRRIWRAPVLAVTFLGCAVLLLAAQLPPSAIDVSGTPSPVTGNATWFTGLGSPYGGCGLPQADLDSQNFLALNVQNSPGVYTNLPRPIPAADASEIGMFADTAESVTSSWNATVSQSGQQVTASSESYNGAIPAGGSATWGMVVTGSNPALSGLTCSLS